MIKPVFVFVFLQTQLLFGKKKKWDRETKEIKVKQSQSLAMPGASNALSSVLPKALSRKNPQRGGGDPPGKLKKSYS